MELYLDVSGGTILDSNEYGEVPIFKGEEDIYIESWWVSKEYNLAIDFAYSQLQQDLGIVHSARKKHFEDNNVFPIKTRSITIPKSKYEEAEKRFSH